MAFVVEKLFGVLFICLTILCGRWAYSNIRTLENFNTNTQLIYDIELNMPDRSVSPMNLQIGVFKNWRSNSKREVKFQVNNWSKEWGDITLNIANANGNYLGERSVVLGNPKSEEIISVTENSTPFIGGVKTSSFSVKLESPAFSCTPTEVNINLFGKYEPALTVGFIILAIILGLLTLLIGYFLLFVF